MGLPVCPSVICLPRCLGPGSENAFETWMLFARRVVDRALCGLPLVTLTTMAGLGTGDILHVFAVCSCVAMCKESHGIECNSFIWRNFAWCYLINNFVYGVFYLKPQPLLVYTRPFAETPPSHISGLMTNPHNGECSTASMVRKCGHRQRRNH